MIRSPLSERQRAGTGATRCGGTGAGPAACGRILPAMTSSPRPRPRRFRAALIFSVLACLLLAAPPVRAHESLGHVLEELDLRVAEAPNDAALRVQRAEMRRLAGAFDGAAEDLDVAERLDPSRPELVRERAMLWIAGGRTLEGLRVLDATPAEGAELGERSKLRARALASLGRTAEAIEAWTVALRTMERVEPDHYLERARLQWSNDREHDARAGLREGVARLGNPASLVLALQALDTDGASSAPALSPRPPADPERSEAPNSESAAPATAAQAPPALDALTVTRGPWLGSPTPNSVSVRWRTSTASNSRVLFGPSSGFYTQQADVAAVGTEHEVVLTGLAANTRYYYTIGSTTETAMGGPTLTFKTHPEPGTPLPVRIWVLGDSGLQSTGQNQVRDAFVAWRGSRDPDVWLMLGDNAYNSGLDAEFQSGLFTPYTSLLRKWPLWLTRGNHDVTRTGANNDYYEFFTLPTAGQAGGVASGTEAYYSFDWGQVHFVCLDSEGSDRSVGSPMLLWLTADLAANTKPWTIAYFHHPPYTKGSHDSDDVFDSAGRMRDMRENALPILEAAGVDLVLTGHSHSWERSFLLDGHYGTSTTLEPSMIKDGGDGRLNGDGAYTKPTYGPDGNEGAVYVVDGSGAQISGGPLNHPAMVSSLNVLGSMIIDIHGERLDARFLSNTSVVRDSFTIVKGSVTAVPGGTLAVDGMALGPAMPNPFRFELSLTFELAAAGVARVEIFDAAGRRVTTLAGGRHAAGRHVARWTGLGDDGRLLPAGVYLASLTQDGRRVTRRIALVR
jgi:tetratricopeptide (TPR) repeat protein